MGKMVRPLSQSLWLCQLSQRESQAVKFSAKVLGAKRNFPAVDLALPLGELARERLRGRTLFKKVNAINTTYIQI